jgi:hypothetical protein
MRYTKKQKSQLKETEQASKLDSNMAWMLELYGIVDLK